ncbi:Stp1/IreP family PP2C-type Ser/Thr phosphatase [Clostridium sp. D2Q-11]|uniref:Stp1/IreP family PP2C-type Ser/Thr phosphatase n=1 Tax=Anaeromonas frigoriresistens TaxID=2683708 RepID=A0A942UY45_9FIRM|nr:Stp1/IreP family PP2C-type Ser/Thr phosphatase [Anaeromonas frigoriresistens]MBS4539740.1 Stp1/IreP family PP2C-type Ser/Thr phosphatase [Anaeromonas frigoriresistens]
MNCGSCSHVGKVRDTNQDSYYINHYDELPIFAVADGMGGHNGGEIASEITIEIIKTNADIYLNKLLEEKLSIESFIKKSLTLSNEEIFKAANENKSYKGMGTTVTMGCIYKNKLYIGHIGDSRAYIARDNMITRLTKDHSLVAELVRNGTITEEEAINHPQKNIITRALGTNNDIEIDIYTYDLQKNDIILLCTDGLTNMVSEREIIELINTTEDIQVICDALINKANDNGGYDNSTVIIIKVDK